MVKKKIAEAEVKEPKKSAKKPEVDLTTLQTEQIWELYHAARAKKNTAELERLRNSLLERHQPLVRYIAERLLQTLPKSIELDDLMSWGNFGLMDAIRGFEPERNIKFKPAAGADHRTDIEDVAIHLADNHPPGKIDRCERVAHRRYGRPLRADLIEIGRAHV